MLQRSPKTYVILKNNKRVTVTVDRLKPAATLLSAPLPPATSPRPAVREPVLDTAPPALDVALAGPALDPESWPLPTRFGRRPRPPERLNL